MAATIRVPVLQPRRTNDIDAREKVDQLVVESTKHEPTSTVNATATAVEDIPLELRKILVLTYEEIMWLAQRPRVTPANARAWVLKR